MDNSVKEILFRDYAENYVDKIFYFCLRKTGNEWEAEDLAGDIALAVANQLERGQTPDNFAAWVWKIARNRFARWAAAKKISRDMFFDSEDALDMLADSSAETHEAAFGSESILDDEHLSMLRSALAFTSEIYRTIVVAHYIEDRKISEIASSLLLPEGTVKARLSRARNKLKEGMKMAKEFGKMSYNPENIGFSINGIPGEDNSPYCYINRLLDKNILLAAYRNPSTAEELSLEIGMALPYMEDELNELLQAELLRMNGVKYETNFYIMSKNVQVIADEKIRSMISELTDAVYGICNVIIDTNDAERPGWRNAFPPKEDILWYYLANQADSISNQVITQKYKEEKAKQQNTQSRQKGSWGHTLRRYDGEWDVVGHEIVLDRDIISCIGCVKSPEDRLLPEINYMKYVFHTRFASKELNYSEAKTLSDIALGKTDEIDDSIAEELCEYGFAKKTESGYEPTSFVKRKSEFMITDDMRKKIDIYTNRALELAGGFYDCCRDAVTADAPEFMRNDFANLRDGYLMLFFTNIRYMVVDEGIKKGYLVLPEDEKRRNVLGAVLEV